MNMIITVTRNGNKISGKIKTITANVHAIFSVSEQQKKTIIDSYEIVIIDGNSGIITVSNVLDKEISITSESEV